MTTAIADDEYAYWNARRDGAKPLFYDGKPQSGLYELGIERAPVQIYKVDGTVYAYVDFKPFTGNLNKVWMACAKNDVSAEAYQFRIANGRWPDQISNEPPADEPTDLDVEDGEPKPPKPIDIRLQELTAEALTWLEANPIQSKDIANAAADKAKAIRDLKNETDKVRSEEKSAPLKLINDIDARYNAGAIKPAEAAMKKIADRIAVYDAAERARRQKEETDRLAAEAAILAEAKKNGTPAPVHIPTVQQAPPQQMERYGTGGGRSITTKPKKIAKILDYDKVYKHHREAPEVREVLQKLAQRCADNNLKCPGIEVVEGIAAQT